MSRTTDRYIDYLNNEATIQLADECGLLYFGDYDDGRPQFTGDNKAWALFNDGGV